MQAKQRIGKVHISLLVGEVNEGVVSRGLRHTDTGGGKVFLVQDQDNRFEEFLQRFFLGGQLYEVGGFTLEDACVEVRVVDSGSADAIDDEVIDLPEKFIRFGGNGIFFCPVPDVDVVIR